jgi:hypothetical protein
MNSIQIASSLYNPCLVIIFNHKYDKNIEKLEALYGSRFTNIFFLVPFYTGTKPNVIPVYESSIYFQGYIAQGFKLYYRPEFTHYFFIGDDLILNPAINERNYAQLLNLDEHTSYIPDARPLHEAAPSLLTHLNKGYNYWDTTFAGINFYSNRFGSEIKNELPSKDKALQLFAKHGVTIKPLAFENIYCTKWLVSFKHTLKTLQQYWKYYVTWRPLKTPGHSNELNLVYPLAYGYSDITIVSSKNIRQFTHYCGVLSANGLFVEMAIPTSLLLAADKIITDKETPLTGRAYWQGTGAALEQQYASKLTDLLADFPSEQLYIHPVKLSRWV